MRLSGLLAILQRLQDVHTNGVGHTRSFGAGPGERARACGVQHAAGGAGQQRAGAFERR